MSQLSGKVAIVTGGSRGIGAGIAKELASQGALVVLSYVSSSTRADAIVKEITSAGGQVVAIKSDAAKYEAAKDLVAATVKAFGDRVDIIVNNAACGDDMPLEDVDEQNFDKIFHTNVRFPLLLAKEAAPFLQQKSRIVNIGSVAADMALATSPLYCASKAALASVTRTLAAAFGHKYSLTCNTVNPGPVRTDMWDAAVHKEEMERAIIGDTLAAPRIAEVEDIVEIVKFLVSEESRWITGNTTSANGGFMVR